MQPTDKPPTTAKAARHTCGYCDSWASEGDGSGACAVDGSLTEHDYSCDQWSNLSAETIDLIIRDVAEIERDPLPDQHPDEMRVTADELRIILEDRLQNV